MAKQINNVRFSNRIDSKAAWSTSTKPLEKGEIGVITSEEGEVISFYIGDGITPITEILGEKESEYVDKLFYPGGSSPATTWSMGVVQIQRNSGINIENGVISLNDKYITDLIEDKEVKYDPVITGDFITLRNNSDILINDSGVLVKKYTTNYGEDYDLLIGCTGNLGPVVNVYKDDHVVDNSNILLIDTLTVADKPLMLSYKKSNNPLIYKYSLLAVADLNIKIDNDDNNNILYNGSTPQTINTTPYKLSINDIDAVVDYENRSMSVTVPLALNTADRELLTTVNSTLDSIQKKQYTIRALEDTVTLDTNESLKEKVIGLPEIDVTTASNLSKELRSGDKFTVLVDIVCDRYGRVIKKVQQEYVLK